MLKHFLHLVQNEPTLQVPVGSFNLQTGLRSSVERHQLRTRGVPVAGDLRQDERRGPQELPALVREPQPEAKVCQAQGSQRQGVHFWKIFISAEKLVSEKIFHKNSNKIFISHLKTS
jgi:hypothetical protein